MCPGFSLFALLPESSAIPEFDATSAIRYRPRESGCSLWSRNNCVELSSSGGWCGETGWFREPWGGERLGIKGLGRPVRMDEEKEADDDDGYKGGCPSSFSSQKQLRIPPGTAQPTVYGPCRWKSSGRNLTSNDCCRCVLQYHFPELIKKKRGLS